jgi:hypothetical protein
MIVDLPAYSVRLGVYFYRLESAGKSLTGRLVAER